MPDQRSLLRGRLANAIGDVVDVASQLAPQATRARAPPLPPPPLESGGRAWTLAAAMEPVPLIVEGVVAPRSSFGPIAPPPPPEHHRSRLPIAVIGSSIIVLVAVIAVHMLTGGATVQAPTHPIGP